MVVGYEPQATKKFFGAAVFQKCCRGVGEQPTFAKQMKLYSEMKQKSKRSVFNHEPQANKKFFGAAIFQKCWRGVGEQPTFAKQI